MKLICSWIKSIVGRTNEFLLLLLRWTSR